MYRSLNRKGAVKKSERKQYGAVSTQEAPRDVEKAQSRLGADNDQLRKLQDQVEDVKDILHDDIDKLIERDGKVTTLNERTEILKTNTSRFKDTATDVRKDAQRRNWKYICCIVCVVVVVLGVVAVIVLYALKVI